jgi:2-polyprenyl-6-methoxyphenol hydroxylase-like FAD-dependent oxidoreductase
MKQKSTHVLVVGAGPVGLLAALRLASRGVEVTVIDERERQEAASFAVVLHPRSVGLLGDLGVTEPLIWQGQSYTHVIVVADGERRAVLSVPTDGELVHGGLTLPQNVLRHALESELTRRGGEILYSHRLVSLEQDATHVRSLLEPREPRSTRAVESTGVTHESEPVTVTSAFVVGADGYDSSVRAALGISLVPHGQAEHFAFFDVLDEPDAGLHVELAFGRETAAMVPLHGGTARYTFQLDAVPTHPLGPAALRALRAARMPWRSQEPRRTEWSGVRTFPRALAEKFGCGRVWLAGDACHATSPLGAQSLNVGLREARDLADAIVGCLEGHAVARLASGYETQRRLEWQRLLGVDSPPSFGPSTPSWVRHHIASLLAGLPASGDDLDDLLAQLGVTAL